MAGTITHYWDGTKLVVTSDSGTSSCDLKGRQGDMGVRGAQGEPGIVTIDPSLSIAGYGADAKAVGDRLTALENNGGGGGGGSTDIDTSNLVTLDGTQSISGYKTFTGGVAASQGWQTSLGMPNTIYGHGYIQNSVNNQGVVAKYLFPTDDDNNPKTIATREWISASYATINDVQTMINAVTALIQDVNG